jgi:hypothetical protein
MISGGKDYQYTPDLGKICLYMEPMEYRRSFGSSRSGAHNSITAKIIIFNFIKK